MGGDRRGSLPRSTIGTRLSPEESRGLGFFLGNRKSARKTRRGGGGGGGGTLKQRIYEIEARTEVREKSKT